MLETVIFKKQNRNKNVQHTLDIYNIILLFFYRGKNTKCKNGSNLIQGVVSLILSILNIQGDKEDAFRHL